MLLKLNESALPKIIFEKNEKNLLNFKLKKLKI